MKRRRRPARGRRRHAETGSPVDLDAPSRRAAPRAQPAPQTPAARKGPRPPGWWQRTLLGFPIWMVLAFLAVVVVVFAVIAMSGDPGSDGAARLQTVRVGGHDRARAVAPTSTTTAPTTTAPTTTVVAATHDGGCHDPYRSADDRSPRRRPTATDANIRTRDRGDHRGADDCASRTVPW